MTISNESIKTTVQGNGAQTTFNYNFLIPNQSAAELYLHDSATGSTVLLAASSWQLNDAGNPAGGTFLYPKGAGAPASGTQSLTLLRRVPYTQTTNLGNQGAYSPRAVENALDWIVMQIQQLSEISSRLLRAPLQDGPMNELPPAAQRANSYQTFSASGQPQVSANAPPALIPSVFGGTLMQTANNAAARTELGSTATGDAVFTASTPAAARATLEAAAAVDAPPSAWTDLASAATTDIGAVNTQNIRITGTTTITSFGTAASGRRQLRFAGALTLTHNATSLILPGGSNITTAAGDTAVAVSLGGGNWVVTDYQFASGDIVARAGSLRSQLSGAATTGQVVLGNGTARLFYDGTTFDLNGPLRANGGLVGINLGTSVNTTSGTSVDFTGIPANVRRVTVMLNGVSTNGTSPQIIQLGTSGGITASGYDSVGTGYGNTITSAAYTTGFGISDSSVAANTLGGAYILSLAGSNVWTLMGLARRAAAVGALATGSVGLSGALDRLRLTTVGGADTFDAGSINISWEF